MNNTYWVLFVLIMGGLHAIGTIVKNEELGKDLRNMAFNMIVMVLSFMIGGIIK